MTRDLRGEEHISGEDLIRRHDDLQGQADDFEGEIGSEDDPLTEDEREELAALAEVYDNVSRDSELIREDKFKDYAQELAENTGAISSDAQWPLNCIDWEQAASELAQDYSSIDFAGESYYVRD